MIDPATQRALEAIAELKSRISTYKANEPRERELAANRDSESMEYKTYKENQAKREKCEEDLAKLEQAVKGLAKATA